jgi:spermidine synthase
MSGSMNDQPTVSEQSGCRYLHFDSPWIQGAMSLRQPHRLVLSYTEQMMAWLLFLQPEADAVIGQLGLGAGSLTRYCDQMLPNRQIVIERNPLVIQVCQQYFRLPGSDRLRVIQKDAQCWVSDPANRHSLSVLMVDLYDADAQGPVCDSLAFYEDCAATLAAPGILSVNLFGHHSSFKRNIDRLHAVFQGRLLHLPAVEQGNQIVLAFKGPPLNVDRATLFARAHQVQQVYRLPALRWARTLGNITI